MSDQTVLTPIPEFKVPRPPRAGTTSEILPEQDDEKAKKAKKAVTRRTWGPLDRRDRLDYMPALDGLRAIAVIAVLAYHADQTWARAGFLGVDIFFVISGYLITALLLSEFRTQGRINVISFWKRRALRLLPSLLVMLAVVSLVVPLLAPDQIPQLRGDLVAALGYFSNWRLIFEKMPYFQAMGRPPLLQHLWSLAVEEQFYLLWPLVLTVALKRKGDKPRGLMFWILLATAVSAGAMAKIWSPESDASRVYYGTDTRMGTILIGAALAFIWMPGQRTARPRLVGSLMRDFAGLGALGALGVLIYRWNEFDPVLYRGGFTVVAVLAAIVVAVSAHPGWLTRRVLGNAPLRWLGKRSYAIYLWHWPVFMLTRPDIDVPVHGYPLLALRLSLTLALAVATYRLVEKPMRNGALGRAWHRLLSWSSFRGVLAGTAVLLMPCLVATGIVLGIAKSRPEVSPSSLVAFGGAEKSLSTGDSPQFGAIDVTEVPSPTPPPAPAPEAAPPAAPAPAPAPAPQTVTAVGDSVMLIARDSLVSKFAAATIPANIDAAIGRQTKAVIAVAQAWKDAGQLGSVVIVHTGTNGPISPRQLDQLMDILKDVPRVFLINDRVARPWESVNNKLLADNIARWPNAKLLDWEAIGNAHPDVFYSDGVHLKPSGVKLYIDMISSVVLG